MNKEQLQYTEIRCWNDIGADTSKLQSLLAPDAIDLLTTLMKSNALLDIVVLMNEVHWVYMYMSVHNCFFFFCTLFCLI